MAGNQLDNDLVYGALLMGGRYVPGLDADAPKDDFCLGDFDMTLFDDSLLLSGAGQAAPLADVADPNANAFHFSAINNNSNMANNNSNMALAPAPAPAPAPAWHAPPNHYALTPNNINNSGNFANHTHTHNLFAVDELSAAAYPLTHPQQQQQPQQQPQQNMHNQSFSTPPQTPQHIKQQQQRRLSQQQPPSQQHFQQQQQVAATPGSAPAKVPISRLPMGMPGSPTHSSDGSTSANMGAGNNNNTANNSNNNKPPTRSAHNVIERRYRDSINEQINGLKMALPPNMRDGSKQNKAFILRKAIDYINHLERAGRRLGDENRRLRELLVQHGIDLPTAEPSASPMHVSDSDGGFTSDFSPASTPAAGPASPSTASAAQPAAATTANTNNNNNSAAMITSSSGSSPLGTGMRLSLSMAGIALCVFSSSYSPLAGQPSAFAAADASAAQPQQVMATSRVLASAGTASSLLDAAALPPQLALTESLLVPLLNWALRLLALVAFSVLVFMRESMTDAESAKARAAHEHEKKCVTAASMRQTSAARSHALKALEHLGRPMPSSRTELALTLVSQVARQALHRVWIGAWLDRQFAARDATSTTSACVGAAVSHELHQLLANDVTVSKGGAFVDSMPKVLLAVQALNMVESAPAAVDPLLQVKVYASAAVQAELLLNGSGAALSNLYLQQAKKASQRCAEQVGALAWLFTSEGHTFFRKGQWTSHVLVGADGERLLPGTLQHLGTCFRFSILEKAVHEYIAGGDAAIVSQRLMDLLQFSVQAQDASHQWWAMLGLVGMMWRTGKADKARRHFTALQALRGKRDRLQEALLAAFTAQHGLLDGDHQACWAACERASTLLHDAAAGSCFGSATLCMAGRLIAFRQLLSVRLALYRLRSHARRQGKVPPSPLVAADGVTAVDSEMMLTVAQEDIRHLRSFAESYALAEPSVYLYQAIARALAGGRLGPTEHLFQQSLKCARRLSLPFDEGLTLLHLCTFLRSSLTPAALRAHLERATAIFQELQAYDEYTAAVNMRRLVLGDM